MNEKIKLFLSALVFSIQIASFSGCATTEKVKLEDADFIGKPLVIVNNIPFVEQTPELCGPTALYMSVKNIKPDLKLEQIKSLTFSPGAKGTYKQDLLSASRRLGLAPYSVASLNQIFSYLAEGVPVIIFHQTDFLWQNYWHFSVLTGYDKPKQTFIVHIGPYPFRSMDISELVKTWKLGGQWAYVVLLPGTLPEYASFEDALDNGLAFIRLELLESALELSQNMQKRWPDRYEADLMMADIYAKKSDNKLALQSLKTAYQKNPKNLILKKKISELSK